MPLSLATAPYIMPGTYMLYQLTPSRWNARRTLRWLLVVCLEPTTGWTSAGLTCLDASQAAEFHQKTHGRSCGWHVRAPACPTIRTHFLQGRGTLSWLARSHGGCAEHQSAPVLEDVVAAGEVPCMAPLGRMDAMRRCADGQHHAQHTPTGIAKAFVEQVMNDCAPTRSRGTDSASPDPCAMPLPNAVLAHLGCGGDRLCHGGWRDLVREHSAAKASTTGIKSAGGMVARRPLQSARQCCPRTTRTTHTRRLHCR